MTDSTSNLQFPTLETSDFADVKTSSISPLATSKQPSTPIRPTQTSTATSSKPCKDEPYCANLNLDESTCQNIPDIFEACYATCSGCSNCRDKEACADLTLSPLLCQHSPWARDNCPKGCNTCEENLPSGVLY